MLGIDLVHIPEFKRQVDLGGDVFLNKAFSPEELKQKQTEHLAGLWAAKEAVLKAGSLPAGMWSKITISKDSSGRPHARVGETSFEIFISHHGEYAVAVAQKYDR